MSDALIEALRAQRAGRVVAGAITQVQQDLVAVDCRDEAQAGPRAAREGCS